MGQLVHPESGLKTVWMLCLVKIKLNKKKIIAKILQQLNYMNI